MKVTFGARLSLIAVILTATSGPLPAPIFEEATPTPIAPQPAKPKPKRTVKPKITSDRAESSTTRPSSPAPRLLSGQFLGVTGEDKVGPWGQTTPNGKPDWHIRLFNVKSDPATLKIESQSGGIFGKPTWVIPFNGFNWVIAKQFNTGTLDLWFEPAGTSTVTFEVNLTYADSSTDLVYVAPTSTRPAR
jgi:hypothetical protein